MIAPNAPSPTHIATPKSVSYPNANATMKGDVKLPNLAKAVVKPTPRVLTGVGKNSPARIHNDTLKACADARAAYANMRQPQIPSPGMKRNVISIEQEAKKRETLKRRGI
mmetsp:Transcript_11433/g.17096  ORF Transcript_11433/g.17096 Transcript_11433/m.17096 type:complete len:110 (+) Transcript_11433:210-539(+)